MMVYKDEVCMWFKDNESHRRLELLCSLLNMCLPFELRFIRTCAEDLGKRDDLLRDLDSKANKSLEISQLGKVLDERTRSKFVVYVALLEANNQTCSKILFETLSNAQQIPSSALINNVDDNINYIKEMLLIYTMVLHHPAFTFEEKRVIGEKFHSLQLIEDQIKSKNTRNLKKSFEDMNLSIESCHPISSPQVYEACDSGFSIGTEPEAETLSDHLCLPAGIQFNSSSDNKFADITCKEPKTINKQTLNPSIGTRKSAELPSNPVCVSVSSVIPPGSANESGQTCPHNRDASSSGSGESLDLYGESVSVPTTYIYNSNIYDHQSMSELPAMALGNNLINFTPGYMYQHNGRYHFCHYPPIMGGVLPPVPMPRKVLPPGLSSETSSGEEGSGVPTTTLLQRGTIPSPQSSSQSSPYVSPPQSLTPSRASSPKEAVTMVSSSHVSHGLVTGTTTTIVISRSNSRPPVKHNGNSNSCNGIGSNISQPSSPALTSTSHVNRNKFPIATTKSQKCVSDRVITFGVGNNENSHVEGPTWIINGPSLTGSCKESASTDAYPSSNKEVVTSAVAFLANPTLKGCGKPLDSSFNKQIPTSNILPLQVIEKDISVVKTSISNTLPSATVVSSSVSLQTNCSVIPSITSVVSLKSIQPGNKSSQQISPVKADKKNKEERYIKDINFGKVKAGEESGKLKSKETKDEKGQYYLSLPNGFNDHLMVSSLQSDSLKHSNANSTTVIPSCAAMHNSGPTIAVQSDSAKVNITSSANYKKPKSSPPASQLAGTFNCVNFKYSNSNNKHIGSETIPINNHVSQNNFYTLSTSGSLTQLSKSQFNLPSSKFDVPPVLNEKNSSERISPLSNSNSKLMQPVTSSVNASHSNSSFPNLIPSSSSSSKNSNLNAIIVQNSNSNQTINTSQRLENGGHVYTSASTSTQNQIGHSVKTTASSVASTYTTTTTNSTMVSLVPSPGSYHPYFSLPMLPGGASSYLPHGVFPPNMHGHPRTPSHNTFFLASASGMVQGNSGHLMKGHHPMIPLGSNPNNNKTRGNSSGRSGSSSSSSSSGLGRKKGFIRGNQYQNKSRSSDSSPSSSQYSSPPQTPSPDHTKDARAKPACPPNGKPAGEGFPVEEVWEPSDAVAPGLPQLGPREENTPPPHAVGPPLMIPSNPVRQRYISYHHPLGFIGYPHPPSHPGMYRYSLPSSPVVMGPRPSTPLSSEKSSRETTPPNNSHAPIGPPENQQKVLDFPNSVTSSSTPYSMCALVSTPSMGQSSTSPPIPGPLADGSSVTFVPPPGQSGHNGAQNGNMNSNIPHYNQQNYPMFAMGTGPFVAHLSGFMHSNSGIPNGYVSPHSLPPSFPVPSMPNGMNSGELVYPNPYPVMAQSTLATSSCGGHPIHHQSSGGHAPLLTPSPALPAYTPSYPNPPPPPNPVPPPTKKQLTCYNCGKGGHRGTECKEASIDEMTKRTKVL